MPQPALTRAPWGLSVVVAACVLAGTVGAQTQKILEINGDSLTSYKASSNPTPVQLMNPTHLNRGVNMDGSLRSGSLQGWTCAGNPFGDGVGWGPHNRLDTIRLDTGTYSPTEVDLALPSIGVQWVIGRTFNGLQKSGGTITPSDGYQGRNWMQTSQPEIVRFEGATDDKDIVYIVYGADRFLEFLRSSSVSDVYKGMNGTAGVVKRTAGSAGPPAVPEKYEYIDQNGTVTTFFGGDYADQAAWQLWRIQDTAGNVCYVGDSSDMATAISSYNDNTMDFPYGAILTAYDSAGRRYSYDYLDLGDETTDGISRLKQVKAEIYDTSWVTVGQVDYDYYGTTINDVGKAGQLRHVTVTTPMTSGDPQVRTTYYRYYTRSWNDSDGRRGHADQIKLVVEAEGIRQYELLDSNFDDDHLGASDSDLLTYSSAYMLEYESSTSTKRLTKATFNGECGCSGGTTGEYVFSYGASGYTDTSTTYQTDWAFRTVVKQPDVSPAAKHTYFTQYFDETGQPLGRVITEDDPAGGTPPPRWVTDVRRDSNGCISELRTPANNTAYDHSSSTGDLDDLFTSSASVGLVRTFTRSSSGDLTGFLTERHWRMGTSGSSKYDHDMSYTTEVYTGTTPNLVRPLLVNQTEFPDEGSATPANTTSRSYTFHDATSTNLAYLAVASVTTTYPTVTDGTTGGYPNNNGSNSATSMIQWFNAYGAPTFAKAPDAIISYREYSATTGQLTKSIADADTSNATDFTGVTIPSTPTSAASSGTEIHNKTTYTYDDQGRIKTVTSPSGRVSRTEHKALDDQRAVTISTPRYESSGTHSYGPAGYTITNQAGRSEATGSIWFDDPTYGTYPNSTSLPLAGWINAAGNAYTCITTSIVDGSSSTHLAGVLHLSTSLYNHAGNQMTESRRYTSFTSMTFPGTSGTNYDATTFGYDPLGRRWRVKDPTATIDRTVFDALGRPIEQWTGTNDHGFTDGEASGTDNMVQVSATEYDGGSANGNGYVTERALDPAGDNRVTTYLNDVRGRVIVVQNPESPHQFNKYDNLGRLVATGQYSDVGSWTIGTDFPTNTAADRLALSETKYDQKGQVYQTVRHDIDQSDGSDDDTLATDYWYDSAGRRIKVQGEELGKTFYDRLGRPTHRFVLAKAQKSGGGDEDYNDADDVTDDIVLEEDQTVYDDPTGNVRMRVQIQRHASGSPSSGPLDTNADGLSTKITEGNIGGRLSITGFWYDDLERLDHSVAYGTYGFLGNSTGSGTFVLGSVAQTADDNRLRTEYTYPDVRTQMFSTGFYGTFLEVSDPKGTVTRTWFDDAGRKVAVIANAGGSAPADGNARDHDIYTRYDYSAGLMTASWIDMDGDGAIDSGDQVTKYFYGVTEDPGGSNAKYSKLYSNRLLHAVVYPDSTNSGTSTGDFYTGSDAWAVTYGYNALGQQTYRKDQSGNVFAREYDGDGRMTAESATTIAGTFDTGVQRIETAYDDRGLMDTVTQKDGPSSGDDILDQLQYSYDGWGNLTKFEQDMDSAIGGGDRASFDVQYALAKSSNLTTTRRTVRRTSMTMPDGTAFDYGYGVPGSIPTLASQVYSVSVDSVTVATYTYVGANRLSGTTLNEANVRSNEFSNTTSAVYPDLDIFNRSIGNHWNAIIYGTPAFYDVAMTYDRASNVLTVRDNIQLASLGGYRNFDVKYTLDGLYRPTAAEEGEYSGSSFASNARLEEWELSQTGNFDENRLDLNWNSSLADAGDVDDTRTHNNANDIASWQPDGSTPLTARPDHNGNMTSDGRDYQFVYDAWGRLVRVTDRTDPDDPSSSIMVSEYRYNGLGNRIGWHYDSDASGFDSADPWFYLCMDERGRVVATYRENLEDPENPVLDDSPKEQYYYHAAGLGGYGTASYIDSVILRDRDMTDNGGDVEFYEAGNGELEERVYYCQNWRQDVSSVLEYTGDATAYQVESIKYFTYGTPFALPAGDVNSDGEFSSAEWSALSFWTSGYDIRTDVNLDGVVNGTDATILGPFSDTKLGRGELSRADIFNRKGFRGWDNDGALADTNTANLVGTKSPGNSRFWVMKGGVFDSTMGRWTTRSFEARGTIGFGTTWSGSCVTTCGWTGCFSSCTAMMFAAKAPPEWQEPGDPLPWRIPDPADDFWRGPTIDEECAWGCIDDYNQKVASRGMRLTVELLGCDRFTLQKDRDSCRKEKRDSYEDDIAWYEAEMRGCIANNCTTYLTPLP